MNEYRCKMCHRLLLKHTIGYGSIEIEVKCPKCKTINKVYVSQILGLQHSGIQPDKFNGKVEIMH